MQMFILLQLQLSISKNEEGNNNGVASKVGKVKKELCIMLTPRGYVPVS
jgi:hypothetical protein